MSDPTEEKRYWNVKKIGPLAAVSIFTFFLAFVTYQSIGEKQTIWLNGNVADRVFAIGETVTIGWKSELLKAIVREKFDDSFVTDDGRTIFFKEIVFARIGERVSVPSHQWDSRDSFERLEKLLILGEPVYFTMKPPPEFTAYIKSKTADGFVASDGANIAYKNVGYVIRQVPFHETFFKNLIKYMLLIPVGLLWAFADFMAVLGYH